MSVTEGDTMVRTGGMPSRRYYDTRMTMMASLLMRAGYPVMTAWRLARTLLPHVMFEVGGYGTANAGYGEFHYNIGNIRGTTNEGWHWIVDDGQRAQFRNYADLAHGAADYLRLLSTGIYRGAWDALLRRQISGLEWYSRIMRAGYSPWRQDNLNGYAAIDQSIAHTYGG